MAYCDECGFYYSGSTCDCQTTAPPETSAPMSGPPPNNIPFEHVVETPPPTPEEAHTLQYQTPSVGLLRVFPIFQLLMYPLIYTGITENPLLLLFPLLGGFCFYGLVVMDIVFLLKRDDINWTVAPAYWRLIGLFNIATLGLFSPILSLWYLRHRKQAVPDAPDTTP